MQLNSFYNTLQLYFIKMLYVSCIVFEQSVSIIDLQLYVKELFAPSRHQQIPVRHCRSDARTVPGMTSTYGSTTPQVG